MTLTRPVVRVFQQFANASPITPTPDLSAIIVGPAYHIRDYADATDQPNIDVGAYGTPSAPSDGASNGRPLPASTVLVLAEPPDNALGAILDEDSVQLVLAAPYVEISTGTGGARSTIAPDEDQFSDAAATFETDGIAAGDRLVLTDDANNTVVKIVRLVESETSLRTQSVMDGVTEFPGGSTTGIAWRLERQVADAAAPAGFVSVSGQTVTVFGGITISVDINGDGVLETRFVASAQMYVEYRSLRQDLADVDIISSLADITENIGRIDERNPLAVGLSIAFNNSNVETFYYGVTSDDLAGHTTAKDAIDNRDDIYAITPLSADTGIIAMWRTAVLFQSDPDRSNFRVLLASAEELPTFAVIGAADSAGTAEQTGDDTIFASTTPGFQTSAVKGGDVLVMLGPTAGPVRYVEQTVDEVIADDVLSMTD